MNSNANANKAATTAAQAAINELNGAAVAARSGNVQGVVNKTAKTIKGAIQANNAATTAANIATRSPTDPNVSRAIQANISAKIANNAAKNARNLMNAVARAQENVIRTFLAKNRQRRN